MKHGLTAGMSILLAALLTGGVDRGARKHTKEGNRNFADGDFPAAAKQYEAAQTKAPQAAEIAYNLGNTLYRQGNFAGAAEQLRRAAAGGVHVAPQSWYNLGNALFKAQNLPEAAAAYRRALSLAPGDRDLKINYEKTLQAMRDQQQQPNQNGQQQQKQKGKQDQQQGDSEQQQAQNQEQKQDEQQKQQGEKGQDGEENRGEQDQPPPEPQEAGLDSTALAAGELRPEEAQRILDAMREQEKELQRERARQMKLRARRTDKDW